MIPVRTRLAEQASIALAILERDEFGSFTICGPSTYAKESTRCDACGVWIRHGDSIAPGWNKYLPTGWKPQWIHTECENLEIPRWPGLLGSLREWLMRDSSPYVLIKSYKGGKQYCPACGIYTSEIRDVRRYRGEMRFPFVERRCAACV